MDTQTRDKSPIAAAPGGPGRRGPALVLLGVGGLVVLVVLVAVASLLLADHLQHIAGRVAGDGTVYFSSEEGSVYAVADDQVLFSVTGGALHSLDLATGAPGAVFTPKGP